MNSRDALHHVDANGLRFAYLEQGEGPLALLLHGFPDTPHTYDMLMRPLAEAGYRVVAPFTRGYAPTQVPDTRATTLDQLADDAISLVTALGHASAVLIGHDWGAATAYLAAARAPQQFSKLVTIGIPHPATLKPSLSLLWSVRHFITLRLPGAIRSMQRNDFALVDALYHRWSPTWSFDAAETAAVKAVFADDASLDAALGYYRGVRVSPAPELRGTIDVPTLTFAGRDDPALDVAVYESARRKFGNGYHVEALPGGHFVHRESPEAFRDAVLSFVGSP
jgi:pimeloyl-ACP methyl ester carboxylesterase